MAPKTFYFARYVLILIVCHLPIATRIRTPQGQGFFPDAFTAISPILDIIWHTGCAQPISVELIG